MKINKTLLGFFLGVVFTGLFAFANNWATNKKWENQAVNRGYGYFSWNIYDKLDYFGNQPLTFHWFDKNEKAKIDLYLRKKPAAPKQKPSNLIKI
jgi:hypothetical protein